MATINRNRDNGNSRVNVRELIRQYRENCDRINEIADLCANENRQRTADETTEFEALSRENNIIQMRISAAAAENMRTNANANTDAVRMVRENIRNNRQTRITLMREIMLVEDVLEGGVVPIRVQDVIEPLCEGLIADKVGLPMPTGLAGDYVWPCYEAVEATVVGEGVALTDTKIAMSKLTANPQRIGIAIPVSRQTIMQTDGFIEMLVMRIIPQSVAMLINKILFGTAKVTNATTLVGPFVGKYNKTDATVMAGDEPTFKELVKQKSRVLTTGVDGTNLCYIMTASMKAIMEATPKDAGSGIMVCENDRIAGLPVFTTHYIGEGVIGLGDWRYQPMGLFGAVDFVIDPYSKARNNAVDFVFNVNYGTVTLRPEAFDIMVTKTLGTTLPDKAGEKANDTNNPMG